MISNGTQINSFGAGSLVHIFIPSLVGPSGPDSSALGMILEPFETSQEGDRSSDPYLVRVLGSEIDIPVLGGFLALAGEPSRLTDGFDKEDWPDVVEGIMDTVGLEGLLETLTLVCLRKAERLAAKREDGAAEWKSISVLPYVGSFLLKTGPAVSKRSIDFTREERLDVIESIIDAGGFAEVLSLAEVVCREKHKFTGRPTWASAADALNDLVLEACLRGAF